MISGTEYLTGSCTNCGGHIEFPSQGRGQSIECPHCREVTVLDVTAPFPASSASPEKPWIFRLILLIVSLASLAIILGAGGYLLIPKGGADKRHQREQANPEGAQRDLPLVESASPHEVRGQMFLVLKDRQTVKLSLVEVRLLKDDSIRETFDRHRSEAVSRLLLLRSNMTRVSSSVAKLQYAANKKAEGDALQLELVNTLNERIRLHTDTLRDPRLPDWFKKEAQESLASIRAEIANNAASERSRLSLYAKTVKDLQQNQIDLKAIVDEIDYLQAPETYLSTFSNNIVSRTTTDADGRFRVLFPEGGRFLLAASVKRFTGVTEEKFGWLVPVSAQDAGEVVLSNNNLFGPL